MTAWTRPVLTHLVEVETSERAVLAALDGVGVDSASSGLPRLRYALAPSDDGLDVYENGDWLAAVSTAGSAATAIVDRVTRIAVDYLSRGGWLVVAGTAAARGLLLGPGGGVAVRGGAVRALGLPGASDAEPGPPLPTGAAIEALLAWAVPSALGRGAAVAEAAALLRAGVHVQERMSHAEHPDALPSRVNVRGRIG